VPELNFKNGIRVVSDGTTSGTKIYNNEDGKPIGGVQRLELIMDANGEHLVEATLRVFIRSFDIKVPKGGLTVEEEHNDENG